MTVKENSELLMSIDTPIEQYFPPIDPTRTTLEAPIRRVTLLEDRALVSRRGTLQVSPGQRRFFVMGLAPVAQDVSLRAVLVTPSEAVRLSDASIRRAMRIRRSEKDSDVRAIEDALVALAHAYDDAGNARERTEKRYYTLLDMLQKGIAEVPEDAAWGRVDVQSWHDTFNTLFEQTRQQQTSAWGFFHEQVQLYEDFQRDLRRQQLMGRPDHRFVAWAELDLAAPDDFEGALEFDLEYVVPNALWRPTHAARLTGSDAPKLQFTASAAIWQNTGEDWNDVELVLSTARSSLGTDPPLLQDDLLRAQRKAEELTIEAREVVINTASVGGGGPGAAAPSGVDLPGVDDGGDIQNLVVKGPSTLPSDGRPNFVKLFTFESEAETSLVSMPELDPRVFLKSMQRNSSPSPVLAGPVELIRDSGSVGWTETLFIAPGERFELSFGPQGELRVNRYVEIVSDKIDPVDKWHKKVTRVDLFLSNLGEPPKSIEISERIPVSEIEQVKIALDEKHSTDGWKVDENGFTKRVAVLPGNERGSLSLWWEMATSPDVTR